MFVIKLICLMKNLILGEGIGAWRQAFFTQWKDARRTRLLRWFF